MVRIASLLLVAWGRQAAKSNEILQIELQMTFPYFPTYCFLNDFQIDFGHGPAVADYFSLLADDFGHTAD